MTLAAGIAAWGVLDVCVPRIDLPVVDAWWGAVAWPGVLLAILAIAGLPHAFNLIDGYNGLAGTVALICCLAIAWVALQVGDLEIMALMLRQYSDGEHERHTMRGVVTGKEQAGLHNAQEKQSKRIWRQKHDKQKAVPAANSPG